MRRSRDKLRNLYRKSSVSSYLSIFRNTVIGIPGISEDEKLDKFCAGLNPHIRVEVMKSGSDNLENAARIVLNMDSAYAGTGLFTGLGGYSSSGPAPMDIGNFESHSYNNRNGAQRRSKNGSNEQRKRDKANNACFKCHKVGCRPWKCRDVKMESNKSEPRSVSTSESDSEN